MWMWSLPQNMIVQMYYNTINCITFPLKGSILQFSFGTFESPACLLSHFGAVVKSYLNISTATLKSQSCNWEDYRETSTPSTVHTGQRDDTHPGQDKQGDFILLFTNVWSLKPMNYLFLDFFHFQNILFIYFRGKGREEDIEEEKHWCEKHQSVALHMCPARNWICTPGTWWALTRNWIGNPSLCKTTLN